MGDTIVTGSKLTAVANAIRTRGGTSAPLTLDAMPAAVAAIPSGESFDWSQFKMGIRFNVPRPLSQNLDLSLIDTSAWYSFNEMFFYTKGLLQVINLNTLDISNVRTFQSMFREYRYKFVYDMRGKTYYNESIDDSRLSSRFTYMFLDSYVTAVYMGNAKVKIERFDTSSVTSMFGGCVYLTVCDVSGLDFSNVSTFTSMFDGCTTLSTLMLPTQENTGYFSSAYRAFRNCKALTSIDLSWLKNNYNLTDVQQCFYGCSALTSVRLPDISFAGLTNYSQVFTDCTNLEHIIWSQLPTVQPLKSSASYVGITSTMKIYVPDALLADYKAATNFSAIESQIYGISDLPSDVAALYGIGD